MPDDSNHLDDDSLVPDWLNDMDPEMSWDMPDAAPDESPPLESPSAPAEGAPWDRLVGQAPPSAEPGAASPPPWQTFEGGATPPPDAAADLPPWGESTGLPAASGWDEPALTPAEPSAEDMAWLGAFGQAADYDSSAPSDDESDMAWLSEDAFDELEQPQAELPAAPESEEDFGWLSEDAFGELEQPQVEPSAAPEPEEDFAWLSEDALGDVPVLASQEPPDIGEPDQPGRDIPDWVLNPEESPDEEPPRSVIRRIRPLAEEPAPEPEPPGDEDALPEWAQAEPVFDEADLVDEMEGLTYEEWEQRQIEREREAERTPEDRLLEEVPDWFDELAAEGEPAPAEDQAPAPRSGEPEFAPGWFMGLEEQDVEAAPDWFQQLDYSPDAMTKPADVPAAPESALPSAEDVPDWFKGMDAPTVEGMDWSAFGAPSEPEEAPITDWLPEPEAEPDEAPVADWLPEPEEEPASGWMDEAFPSGDALLPDLGDLTSEPDAEDRVSDWLGAPGEDMIAAPDEVPFPDLDLDQPMPTESVEREIDALMEGFLPVQELPSDQETAPADDFVERFDPLDPEVYVAPPVDEEAPDWLRQMADEGPAAMFGDEPGFTPTPAEEVDYAPPDEGMDWLSAISPEEAPVPEAPETWEPDELEPAPVDQDRMDSVAIDDLLSLYAPPEEPAPEEAPTLADDEWPAPEEEAWPVLAEEPGVEEVFGAPTDDWGEEQAVPDLETLFAEAGEAEVLEPPGEPEPLVLPDAERPEWIEEMRPSDMPVKVRGGGAEKSVTQKPVLELPERARALRDSALQEAAKAAEPEGEPVPDVGPLAGIAGALPLAGMILAAEQVAAPARGAVANREQHARAARLQALLDAATSEEEPVEQEAEYEPFSFGEEAPAPAAPAKHPRSRARFKPDRLIVSLVLLIGLLIPFATDVLHFATDPAPLSGDRLAVAGAVDALQPGQYVLFAFEYGPTAAGELDALADAVLRDVLTRGAVPLTISTNPAGAFHAQAVMARLAGDKALLAARGTGEDALQAGEDYVLLSYLPGEAIGVRLLAAPYQANDGTPKIHPAFSSTLRGDSSGLLITSLEQDITLIVVVGEGSEDVRVWAEQLTGVAVPKVALVTAALEPMAVPYVNEDAYAGYLAGYRDTYNYNTARNATARTLYTVPDGVSANIPNPEEARWHSMALGAALAAGLIALGMVVNLFRAVIRRPRR